MLTVDFGRLPIAAGDRLLDLGCGGGRHAFEAARRGAKVVAVDTDRAELDGVAAIFAGMAQAGEMPDGASGMAVAGDATRLPFPDGAFDTVIAAEVLEHLPADQKAMNEIARVLRPGGTVAVTVPAWLPERICWRLSDDYHNTPGGHIRIFTRRELTTKLTRSGLTVTGLPPRARAALPLLVAQVRGRRQERRSPAGQRVPQAACLGHHAQAAGDPPSRSGAEPADRQEPRRLRGQACGSRIAPSGPARPAGSPRSPGS